MPALARLLVLLLLVTGCAAADGVAVGGDARNPTAPEGAGSSPGSSEQSDAASIEGSWVLTKAIVDGEELPLSQADPVTLIISGGSLSGTAGCNSYSAELATGPDVNDVRPGLITRTRMACEPPVMVVEDGYLDALARVKTATSGEAAGDQLVLGGEGVELRLTAAGS